MQKVKILLVTSFGTLVNWPTTVWAQVQSGSYPNGYGPHMMWGDGGWSMFFFGPFMMVLLIAAVFAATVFLVRAYSGSHTVSGPHQRSNRALDILKERFARGEIDLADFEERRKVLGE